MSQQDVSIILSTFVDVSVVCVYLFLVSLLRRKYFAEFAVINKTISELREQNYYTLIMLKFDLVYIEKNYAEEGNYEDAARAKKMYSEVCKAIEAYEQTKKS